MKCILEGHEPRLYNGHGAFQGAKYWVCIHCGRTEQHVDGRAPNMTVAPTFDLAHAEINPIEVH